MENHTLHQLYQAREKLKALLGQSNAKIVLEDLCFPKQLAFIKDPSQFVTAGTSRRAGKTTACAMHLIETAIKYPNSTLFYITYARTDAKGIIWPMLHQINRQFGVGAIPNESDLTFKFDNGSMIRLGGAATAGEIDRFRGYSIKLVYVDEAQRIGNYLQGLVDDVLVPACFDTSGSIRITGTPGPVAVGYFHEISSDPESTWSRHHWTMFDNPFIEQNGGKSPQVILEQELERRGVEESDATIQREMFGRWVTDTRRLVIEYNSRCNHYESLPPGKYNHVIGIDLGFHDADAIVVVGYSDDSDTTFLIDELVTPKQGLSELVVQVERMWKKYDAHKLVIDTGGLGLKIAEEMQRRYRIPVVAAEKTRKFETIEIFNDALKTGRFKAKSSSRFANDSMLLEWDMDKLRPDRKVISDRFHSDIIDSTLYAFRESPAYAYVPPTPKSKPYTPEWYKEQEDEMERLAIEQVQKQNDPFDKEMWQ